jgi:hypothetical protein
MPVITIDGKQYDTDKMSETAKIQLTHLQATDIEIQRLNIQVAIFQTARVSYINALKQELEKPAAVKPAQANSNPTIN